jgi:hypothetical protein
MDEAQLAQTPGYQFTKNQGMKAVQSGYAARGLGISGGAEKGAADYVTGLADNTYNQQFANEVTNRDQQYNKLLGVSSMGANAAAGVGQTGSATAGGISNNITGLGNAQAGAYTSAGNAIGSAAQSIPNSLILSQLIGKNGSGSGYTGYYGSGSFGHSNGS